MKNDGMLQRWFALLAVGAVLALPGAASAQRSDDPQAGATRESRKRLEQEARAQEYLLRKEIERARRQLLAEGKMPEEAEVKDVEVKDAESGDADIPEAVEATEAETIASKVPPAVEAVNVEAPAETPADVAAAAPAPEVPRKKRASRPPSLPSAVARAQKSVRNTKLGQDPTVQVYLDMVDRQEASPHHLAALGRFLAQNGMLDEALAYYRVAINLEHKDPLLWLNLGTLHRQRNEFSAALSAYGEALALDPNNSLAHYNIGAILDETGDYQGAVDQYKTALTLDPSLGDPAVNPQAANNERLLAVKMLLYREKMGSLGLPLVEIPSGGGRRNE